MNDSTAPNVVLICADQWRGDCLGIDGHPVVKTPTLDRLAQRGFRYSRCYSATPTCIAARAALMTGLSQRHHGRVGYRDGVAWNYRTTMAGEFTRQGYQTQAIGKMHVFPDRERLGFEHVLLHDGYLHFSRRQPRDPRFYDDYLTWLRQQTGNPQADYYEHGIHCNSHIVRPWDRAESLHPTNWVIHQGIDFLYRRDPRRPFFLMLSFHRPHPPYDPPQWAYDMYADVAMPEPPLGAWRSQFDRYNKTSDVTAQFQPDIDAATLRRARAGYYGHMTHIDHQINRFIETMGEFGLEDNTWFCFLSDHGELMGDHQMFNKGRGYEGAARVPLILAGPKHSRLVGGAVTDCVVELRDIMPTLLEAAGLEIPCGLDGRSALAQARGTMPGTPWREYLHGEHTIAGESQHWLTDGRMKYFWWSGSGIEQLFDLRTDPTETHDLSADGGYADEVSAWRRRMVEELTGRQEGFVDGDRLIAGRPVTDVLEMRAAGSGNG